MHVLQEAHAGDPSDTLCAGTLGVVHALNERLGSALALLQTSVSAMIGNAEVWSSVCIEVRPPHKWVCRGEVEIRSPSLHQEEKIEACRHENSVRPHEVPEGSMCQGLAIT